MLIHVWGTDFRRSHSDLRSHLFLKPEMRKQMVERLIMEAGLLDLVYLATCHRVEFYTTAPDHFLDMRPRWLKMLKALGSSEEDYYRGYHLEGKSAMRHLFRVASSLESMAVGESQILGQLKESLRWTDEQGFAVEVDLRRAFSSAFEIAKRVRTETEIGARSVSVASLALESFQQWESRVAPTSVAVVGRGPISLCVLRWLLENRPGLKIHWVNRTVSALSEFAESKKVEVHSLESFLSDPAAFNYLFTATGAGAPLFDQTFLESLEPQARVFFDLAQPDDIGFGVFDCDCHSIVRLDDLQQVARVNIESRSESIGLAEKMIEDSLRAFCRTQKEGPVIRQFSAVEPELMASLAQVFELIEEEFPPEFHARLKVWAEKLVRRNLHQSREHLRTVLRHVASSPESSSFMVV